MMTTSLSQLEFLSANPANNRGAAAESRVAGGLSTANIPYDDGRLEHTIDRHCPDFRAVGNCLQWEFGTAAALGVERNCNQLEVALFPPREGNRCCL
jgi:hypothetical protein